MLEEMHVPVRDVPAAAYYITSQREVLTTIHFTINTILYKQYSEPKVVEILRFIF